MISTYYGLLRRIHECLRPDVYLEIGVHEGHSIAFVGPDTRAIGIDPEPKVDELPDLTTVFAVTSDEFFDRTDINEILGGPIDLAFVDGLHLFQQTLRDIANVESHCSADGVILVHDCLPIDAVTSSPERTTVVWSGDVWKSVVALRRYRPDLSIHTVDVAPTGMAVITGLDPTNTTIFDCFDEIVESVVDLTFDDLILQGTATTLATVPAEWDDIRELLTSRPAIS